MQSQYSILSDCSSGNIHHASPDNAHCLVNKYHPNSKSDPLKSLLFQCGKAELARDQSHGFGCVSDSPPATGA